MPIGYITAGATTTSPDGSAEFNGSVPDAVPVAYIAFSMGSSSGPGQIHEGLIEAIANASSTVAAVGLLRRTELLGDKCGGQGTTITLPGSVPNLTVVN